MSTLQTTLQPIVNDIAIVGKHRRLAHGRNIVALRKDG